MAYHFGTVDDLLMAADTSRRQKRGGSGCHWDHIIELQLILAAVNRMTAKFAGSKMAQQMILMGQMINFFQEDHNFQPLPPFDNRKKRDAVTRLISKLPHQDGDGAWIKTVRDKWREVGLRAPLIQSMPAFVQSMNSILDIQICGICGGAFLGQQALANHATTMHKQQC